MKLFSILGLAVGLSLPAFPGLAAAQTCQTDCAVQVKACVLAARTTKTACRLDCRTNSAQGAIGGCFRACVDGFRVDRAACQDDVPGCVTACETVDAAIPDGGSVPCLGGCGQNLGNCAQSVTSQGRDCAKTCRGASDRLECLQACAATARDGAEGCASDFASCHADCAGSPGGAFID